MTTTRRVLRLPTPISHQGIRQQDLTMGDPGLCWIDAIDHQIDVADPLMDLDVNPFRVGRHDRIEAQSPEPTPVRPRIPRPRPATASVRRIERIPATPSRAPKQAAPTSQVMTQRVQVQPNPTSPKVVKPRVRRAPGSAIADADALPDAVRSRLNRSYSDTDPGALFGCAVAVAMSALQMGWNHLQVRSLLMNKVHPLSELMYLRKPSQGSRPRTVSSARAEAEKAIAKAQARIAESPAGADARTSNQLLGEVTAALRAEEWNGRAARTDLLVLDAVMDVVRRRRGETISFSCRQVVLAVGCSASTASNSLKRLVKRGFLSPTTTARRRADGTPVVMSSAASTWTLRVPDRLTAGRSTRVNDASLERGPEEHVQQISTLAHYLSDDLWSTAGLGQSAGRVAWDLQEQGVAASLRELVTRTGLSLRTVHLAIKALRQAGLVCQDLLQRSEQSLQVALDVVDADRLPEVPAARGASERRAQRVAAERKGHAERVHRNYLFVRRAKLEQIVLDRPEKKWEVLGGPQEAASIVSLHTGEVLTDARIREAYGDWSTLKPQESALAAARAAMGISEHSLRKVA